MSSTATNNRKFRRSPSKSAEKANCAPANKPKKSCFKRPQNCDTEKGSNSKKWKPTKDITLDEIREYSERTHWSGLGYLTLPLLLDPNAVSGPDINRTSTAAELRAAACLLPELQVAEMLRRRSEVAGQVTSLVALTLNAVEKNKEYFREQFMPFASLPQGLLRMVAERLSQRQSPVNLARGRERSLAPALISEATTWVNLDLQESQLRSIEMFFAFLRLTCAQRLEHLELNVETLPQAPLRGLLSKLCRVQTLKIICRLQAEAPLGEPELKVIGKVCRQLRSFTFVLRKDAGPGWVDSLCDPDDGPPPFLTHLEVLGQGRSVVGLSEALERIPSIRSLGRLKNIANAVVTLGHRYPQHPPLNLEVLVLYGRDISQSPQEINTLIRMLPALRQLHLCTLPSLAPFLKGLHQIQDLILEDPTQGDLEDTLRVWGPKLTSLSLLIPKQYQADLSEIGHFCTSLRSLKVYYDETLLPIPQYEDYSFSCLESLVLRHDCWDKKAAQGEHLDVDNEQVLEVMLQSPRLQELEICICLLSPVIYSRLVFLGALAQVRKLTLFGVRGVALDLVLQLLVAGSRLSHITLKTGPSTEARRTTRKIQNFVTLHGLQVKVALADY